MPVYISNKIMTVLSVLGNIGRHLCTDRAFEVGAMAEGNTPGSDRKNLWFSGVFRGYKMGTLIRNGLKLKKIEETSILYHLKTPENLGYKMETRTKNGFNKSKHWQEMYEEEDFCTHLFPDSHK